MPYSREELQRARQLFGEFGHPSPDLAVAQMRVDGDRKPDDNRIESFHIPKAWLRDNGYSDEITTAEEGIRAKTAYDIDIFSNNERVGGDVEKMAIFARYGSAGLRDPDTNKKAERWLSEVKKVDVEKATTPRQEGGNNQGNSLTNNSETKLVDGTRTTGFETHRRTLSSLADARKQSESAVFDSYFQQTGDTQAALIAQDELAGIEAVSALSQQGKLRPLIVKMLRDG